MVAVQSFAPKHLSLMIDTLVRFFYHSSVPHPKLVHPFDVRCPAPASHQRCCGRATIFVSENCGVPDLHFARTEMKDFVVHQEREIGKMINCIRPLIKHWRISECQEIVSGVM